MRLATAGSSKSELTFVLLRGYGYFDGAVRWRDSASQAHYGIWINQGADSDWQGIPDREAIVQKSNILRIEPAHSPSNAAKIGFSDVLEIITVFSARLYGSRCNKTKKLLEAVKDTAEELSAL